MYVTCLKFSAGIDFCLCAIDWRYHSHNNMDPFDNVRLTHLRARLTRVRSEKLALAHEIQLLSTHLVRKHECVRHYAAVDAEMRSIASEMEDFIVATKYALATKKMA
jgi:hypothetical protein